MKRKYLATLEYTMNNKKETLNDTYIIETDCFWGSDDIRNYIKHDLMLIAGGGYSTANVKNAKLTLISA